MSGSQAECVGGCTQYRFNTQNDCCRIRWLAGCFAPHALAMLDNWQAKDAKILGQAKAIERRKVIVKMAKMNSGALRSFLSNRVASSMDCDRVKREAWRNDGDFVLMHDQIDELPLAERKLIEQLATRIYGLKTVKG